MSDEKHSPGPWRWDGKQLLDANGRDVAWGYVDTDYDDDLPTAIKARSPADALLIAAAPEMLALLREVYPQNSHQHADAFTCWFCRTKRLLERIDGGK